MSERIIGRIQGRLDALGLSARAASLQAGLGADGIRNILRGKSESPRGTTLVKLAEVLQCSVSYLAGEEAVEPTPPQAVALSGDLRARRLRAARMAYWRTPEAAAEALGVGLHVLQQIEAGEVPLDDAFLMRFASITETPLDWLFLGKITEPMHPVMAARIALFDPALVVDDPSAAPIPAAGHETASRKPRP
jgi:transcriptional regulator with XRE-family HTH domain